MKNNDPGALSPDLLLSAVESSTNGIVIADAQQEDRPLIYVNPAFEKMTGYTREEIIGKNCRFLQGNDSEQHAIDVLRENIKAGKACTVKLRNYTKSGTLFWNELNIAPVYDHNHQLTHYVGIQKDITDQENAQREVAENQKQLQRLVHQLSELSFHDPLSGVGNRRLFELCLTREWGRALRDRTPLSLAMFDIDDFKNYNDHYGHQSGDTCIKEIAQCINKNLKQQTDLAARYGGEEFVALMPDTDLESAKTLIENIRSDINRLGLEHKLSSTAHHVSVSIGLVSRIPKATEAASDLVRDADALLYTAKREGRNRVIS